MSVESARREIENIRKQLSRLHSERAQETKNAAALLTKANSAEVAASRTSSLSSRQSKLREAQRHRESHAKLQKKIADIESKISAETKRLGDTEMKLLSEQAREQRQQQQRQERLQREQARDMRSISDTLVSHTWLHATTQAMLDRLCELPETINVLFLAANPIDRPQLRLDEEARAIHERIRMSEHRDAVQLVSRWALRPGDVLQALNECDPRVVHFSGHGSETGAILFQDDMGQSKSVSQAAIVEAMAATAGKIQLVFFNNCHSRERAEAVTRHVPAAIGMSTAISDEAARVFSAQFYGAIGFGHSVDRAFKQARAALMLEGIPEESTPELFLGEGVDGEELVLVRPASPTDAP